MKATGGVDTSLRQSVFFGLSGGRRRRLIIPTLKLAASRTEAGLGILEHGRAKRESIEDYALIRVVFNLVQRRIGDKAQIGDV